MDKFEQISNPVGESNFEFQFEDVAPQMQNEEENSDFTPVVPSSDHQSVDEKLPDEAAVPLLFFTKIPLAPSPFKDNVP